MFFLPFIFGIHLKQMLITTFGTNLSLLRHRTLRYTNIGSHFSASSEVHVMNILHGKKQFVG